MTEASHLSQRPDDVAVTSIENLSPLFQENETPIFILDVRDPEEVANGKGGPPYSIPGSINVPLNHDGILQSERLTSLHEFLGKLQDKRVELPSNKDDVIITHCGRGGRGGKAAALLLQAGYRRVYNGGGPSHIATAMDESSDKQCGEEDKAHQKGPASE